MESKMIPIEPIVDITLSAKDLLETYFSHDDDDDDLRSRSRSRSGRWYSSDDNTASMLLSGSDDLYTPTTDDVGKVLVLEVEGKGRFVTQPVIPLNPSPRQMIQMKNDTNNDGSLTFTVVTYNVLADVLATSQQYPDCPSFALKWAYRRQNLLNEILQCDPDIICLQEVQQNHFLDFFHPELKKLGYEGVFKGKEREPGIIIPTVDGCATFYKLNKFELLTHWWIHLMHNRDNIALQVILSFKNINRSLCIANTHIHANTKNRDIKLLQVHYLVEHLETYVRNNPDDTLVLCGDFNSLPASAVHSLLTKGRVDASHEEFLNFDRSEFHHTIGLGSAYFSYSQCNVPPQDVVKKIGVTGEPHFTNFVHKPDHRPQDVVKKIGVTGEPRFTNFVEFKGTLDYILYSPRKLKVVSLLELIDEDEVKDRALPSVKRSSDHIPIAAEFKYISGNKQRTSYGRNYR